MSDKYKIFWQRIFFDLTTVAEFRDWSLAFCSGGSSGQARRTSFMRMGTSKILCEATIWLQRRKSHQSIKEMYCILVHTSDTVCRHMGGIQCSSDVFSPWSEWNQKSLFMRRVSISLHRSYLLPGLWNVVFSHQFGQPVGLGFRKSRPYNLAALVYCMFKSHEYDSAVCTKSGPVFLLCYRPSFQFTKTGLRSRNWLSDFSLSFHSLPDPEVKLIDYEYNGPLLDI